MDNIDRSWMSMRRWSDKYNSGVNNFFNKAFQRASKGNESYALAKYASIVIGITKMWWRIT